MSLVLVVDDSRSDQLLAATFLAECGVEVDYATDGTEALEMVERKLPDLVLTDLQMPGMNGLELVRALRSRQPALPILLMTAHGTEKIAFEALQAGATSYIPKRYLPGQLAETVRDILAVVQAKQAESEALRLLVESSSRFRLGCEVSSHEGVIGHLLACLVNFGLCDETDTVRIGTALHEALVNAREHGNLELTSDLRERGDGSYHRLLEERARQEPYCQRSVHVGAHFTRVEATIQIRDEGPGFNYQVIPDPTDKENLAKPSGRGLFLIQTFMDHVIFNKEGNEITMIKRRGE